MDEEEATKTFMVLDIETDGIGSFRPARQRPIEIAWIVCNTKGVVSKRESVFVSGVERIASGAKDVHGYSKEFINKRGVPLCEAMAKLEKDVEGVEFVVGHNIDFDVGCLRYQDGLLDNPGHMILHQYVEKGWGRKKGAPPPRKGGHLRRFLELPTFCTMRRGTEKCKILMRHGGYKWPKLSELACHAGVAVDAKKLHGAMYDVEITLQSYLKLWCIKPKPVFIPAARSPLKRSMSEPSCSDTYPVFIRSLDAEEDSCDSISSVDIAHMAMEGLI